MDPLHHGYDSITVPSLINCAEELGWLHLTARLTMHNDDPILGKHGFHQLEHRDDVAIIFCVRRVNEDHVVAAVVCSKELADIFKAKDATEINTVDSWRARGALVFSTVTRVRPAGRPAIAKLPSGSRGVALPSNTRAMS